MTTADYRRAAKELREHNALMRRVMRRALLINAANTLMQRLRDVFADMPREKLVSVTQFYPGYFQGTDPVHE